MGFPIRCDEGKLSFHHAKFRQNFICFWVSVIFLVFFSLPLKAEFVFLKDGSIIEGTIIHDAKETTTLRKKNGQEKIIKRIDIMRILYTKLYMGKIYVQKRSGEGLEAYMVDEDQETYIFRKQLYKPDEFILKRKDVLFISQKNPSGLSGKAETDSVRLEWLPPYNRVKEYRIYMKIKKRKKFKQVGRSDDKKFVMEDLTSNTTYYFLVKAVDFQNYESLPSNQIKVTTLNIKPTAPENILRLNRYNKDGSTLEVKMKWEQGSDPDGRVTGYHIYMETDKGYKKIGKTPKSQYAVKKLESGKTHRFRIRSVDNLRDESVDSSTVSSSDFGYYLRGFVPGWGQYNAGYGLKSGLYGGGFLLSGIVTIFAWTKFTKARDDYNNLPLGTTKQGFLKKRDKYSRASLNMNLLYGLMAFAYIANLVDIIFFTDPEYGARQAGVGEVAMNFVDLSFGRSYEEAPEDRVRISFGRRF